MLSSRDFNMRIINDDAIDTLYRGRFEENNQLKEYSEDGKGYFYLSFYNDEEIQFWAEEFKIIKKGVS